MTLSFAEEIYLLALDDATGKIALPSPKVALNSTLTGAVLCELSFLKKIDYDQENLFVLNTELTGDPILDDFLSIMKNEKSQDSISFWIDLLLRDAKKIEKLVQERLINRGIIKLIEEKILWVIPSRRYPIIDDREIKDVESRLRELVLSDEIPDPREAVLVSLVHACDLFEEILSPKEFKRSLQRIETLSKLDFMGQEIIKLIEHIEALKAMAPLM